jgi:hypothetical protein
VSHLYRGESRVVLGFRVGPRTNRLVEDKGSGKKRGKRAAVRKSAWPRKGIEPKS